MDIVRYAVGDIVKMKKAHPCGSSEWEVQRTGIDFGLKCQGCGRYVMISRPKFEKAVKAIIQKAPAGAEGKSGQS
jgi:hypothetical protein